MTEKDAKQKSLEQYGRVADAYVKSKTHAQGKDLDALLNIAAPAADWLVLDVATGGGHTALTFAPHVREVVAVDLTPNMLETAEQFVCRERGMANVAFRQADAENLPFEPGAFDLVTCRIAPHHFPDCQAFVAECARVLKADGLLLIQDIVLPEDKSTAAYVDSFEKLRDPSHHQAYTENGWRSMYEKAGLTVEHVEFLSKRHVFLDWAKRMNNSEETVQRLIRMVKQAAPPVVDWMQPIPSASDFDKPQASFINHHMIIAGRKQS